MSKKQDSRRRWIVYVVVPVMVHLALYGPLRAGQFTDTPLQHTWVRIAISVVAVPIVEAALSRRPGGQRNSLR